MYKNNCSRKISSFNNEDVEQVWKNIDGHFLEHSDVLMKIGLPPPEP